VSLVITNVRRKIRHQLNVAVIFVVLLPSPSN
jgi:hypothetical protein